MNKFKIILTISVIALGLLAVSFFVGKFSNDKNKKEINSQVILERIENQYFLVTKTMILDEEIEIVNKNTSG